MNPLSLRELFDHANGLPAADRGAFLDANCPDPALRARVERLLDAARREDDPALRREPLRWSQDIGAAAAGRRREIGQDIGGYRIEELLGEGGTARVYRATRAVAGVERTVALKVLHQAGAVERTRILFERERAALARLDHPSIARFVDAGVSEHDEAWIALEYVAGERLPDYLSRTAPPLRERVRLMIEIAQAVSVAHRNLVVHRDLKPGNVLVDAGGRVKLLDFGIAKLLEPSGDDPATTRTQWRAFTPAYAAPEQRDGGAITTATDVYALGVMLGEWVDGRAATDDGAATARPFAGGADLANIVRKASAPAPDDRYATAVAFAEDLQRWLDGLPVLAHPPSGWYRARKFLLRHRGGVLSATAGLCAVLAALGIAVWQSGVARSEARRAHAVTTFLLEVIEAAQDRMPGGRQATLSDVARSAADRLDADATLDVDTRVEVLRTLGDVSELAAERDAAGTLYAEAVEGLAQAPPDDPRRAAIEVRQLALQAQRGEYAAALAAADALAPRLPAGDVDARLRLLDVRAGALLYLGRQEAAVQAAGERVAEATAAYGALDERTLRAALYLGNVLATLRRPREALAVLEPALSRWRSAGLPQDGHLVAGLGAQAVALGAIGRLEDSVSRFEELLRLVRAIYASPHDRIASALRNYASNLSLQGRHQDAVAAHGEANAMFAALYGADHRHVLSGRNRLAMALERLGDAERAETEFRAVAAACKRSALRDAVCPVALNGLATLDRRAGRLQDARRWGEAALAANRALHGRDEQHVAASLVTLSSIASAQGRTDEAIDLSAQAMAAYEAGGTADGAEGAFGRARLAKALRAGGRHAEALDQIQRAIAAFDRAAPGDLPNRTDMRLQLAQTLRSLGREAEAREAALQAVALGAEGARLPASARAQLRELSGRADLYPGLD